MTEFEAAHAFVTEYAEAVAVAIRAGDELDADRVAVEHRGDGSVDQRAILRAGGECDCKRTNGKARNEPSIHWSG